MTTMTFPSDKALASAFEGILNQIDTARRAGDPKDKEEQAYWRAQHNAFAKAQAHFLEGVRPLDTGSSYLLRSATRPDAVVHRVRQAGGVWLCSCESTGICWHAAFVGAIDLAADETERAATYEDAIAAMDELFA